MVYAQKEPVIPQNRRLIFCLQQADRLLKLVDENKELRTAKHNHSACVAIYETAQKLLCIQPLRPSVAAESESMVRQARGLKKRFSRTH
jgi:hypothetical protein